MEMAVRELVHTLESMQQMYEALRTIAQQKKDHIMKNEIQDLTACMAQETKLLKSLTEHEAAVKSASTRIQRDLGLRPKLKIALSEIIKLISNPTDKQELMRLQAGIVNNADLLRKENELNQQLILQSLDYVNFSLDVMYGEPEEEVVYKKPNITPDSVKRSAQFDTRG